MRLLLDECIDQRLRHLFPGHAARQPHTQNWPASNGALISAAQAPGFDVLVTVDQGIAYQQNLAGEGIALLILLAPTNRLYDLQRLIPEALEALFVIRPGQILRVS